MGETWRRLYGDGRARARVDWLNDCLTVNLALDFYHWWSDSLKINDGNHLFPGTQKWPEAKHLTGKNRKRFSFQKHWRCLLIRKKPELLLSTICNLLTHIFVLTDCCQVIWISCPVKIKILHTSKPITLSSSLQCVITSSIFNPLDKGGSNSTLCTESWQLCRVTEVNPGVGESVCENLGIPVNEYVAMWVRFSS